MTTIKEILQPYYPSKENNPGYPLTWWLGNLGKTSRARKMRHDFSTQGALYALDQFCKTYKQNYFPDDVVYLLEQINVHTVNNFTVWLDNMNAHNPIFFYQTLAGVGKIDIPLFPVKDQELVPLMLNTFPGFSNVEYKDVNYQVTTKEGLQEILHLSPAKNFAWSPDRRDCDDFVRIFRGWLSKNSLGNLVIGDCEIDCYAQGQHKYSHNICLVAIKKSNKLQFVFCEPQSENYWPVTEHYPDISIDEVKLRKVIF